MVKFLSMLDSTIDTVVIIHLDDHDITRKAEIVPDVLLDTINSPSSIDKDESGDLVVVVIRENRGFADHLVHLIFTKACTTDMICRIAVNNLVGWKKLMDPFHAGHELTLNQYIFPVAFKSSTEKKHLPGVQVDHSTQISITKDSQLIL